MTFYTLSNGMKLPAIGFGTYQAADADNIQTISDAIQCGYRFFDTASLYETERNLGNAIKQSGIPREEFIIETKMWIDEKGYEGAKKALNASLERLQTDYVDLYLIHWPRRTGAFDENWQEVNRETWRAMEEMQAEGKIRALGCSNFLPHHLEALLPHCKVLPVVNQLELHPGYSQEAAVSYCQAHQILPMAWSPLARGCSHALEGNDILLHLAEKYGKSVQQINLRFLLQKGILPIPKASSIAHMKSNLDVFDFALTDEEVWLLTCMPQTTGLGEHPDFAIPDRPSNPNQ